MADTSLIAIFSFSFVLAIGAVMSPGPVSTAIVSQSPRLGWRVGPSVAFGHSILEFIIVIALAFGLQGLLAQPGVESAIALLGGGLLIWMGLNMLLGTLRGKLKLPTAGANAGSSSIRQMIWLGVIATLANPVWYAWWVSVPPSYLAQASAIGLAPLAAFYLGHISADFLWDTLLASLVSGGRKWMTDRIYAAIIALCALFFVYLGLTFLMRGLDIVQTLLL